MKYRETPFLESLNEFPSEFGKEAVLLKFFLLFDFV